MTTREKRHAIGFHPVVIVGAAATAGIVLAGVARWARAESPPAGAMFQEPIAASPRERMLRPDRAPALARRSGAASASNPPAAPEREPARVRRNLPEPLNEPVVTEWAIDSMQVLTRPQTAAEHAEEIATAAEIARLTDPSAAPHPDMVPGRIVTGSFRVLANDVGAQHATAYAFRTDQGRVCGGLRGVVSGCLEGFTSENGVNWSIGTGPNGGTTVFGIAPDRVAAVNVVFDGGSQLASVTSNAFFAEIAGHPPTAIEALELVTGDGDSHERIAIHLGEAPTR